MESHAGGKTKGSSLTRETKIQRANLPQSTGRKHDEPVLKLGRVLRLGILALGEAELSAHPRGGL